MTAGSVVLIALGVLGVLVLICAAALWWDRSGENKAYDERQLMEQGRARAVADTVEATYFFLLLAYLAYAEFNGVQTLPVYLWILIGLLIQVMTYQIYCVMTHAALPFGQNPKSTIFWALVAGLHQFGNYYSHHRQVSLFAVEDGGIGLLNLIAGTALLFQALIHLTALLRKDRE